MKPLTIVGDLLTASAEDRTITGRLLPYGQVGRTSAGRVMASAGCITVPDASSVTLNVEHDPTRPVGRGVKVTEQADGLHATFRVARTTAGDDLLAEVAEGLRASLSVEIDRPVIRDGKIVGGTLTAAAAVVQPAFPDAGIYALTAADAGDEDDAVDLPEDESSKSTTEEVVTIDGVQYKRITESTYTTTTEPIDGEPADEDEDDDSEEEPTVTASRKAAAPAGLPTNRRRTSTGPQSLKEVTRLLARGFATGDRETLTAALSDVKFDGTGGLIDTINQPAWLGELWSGKDYVQKIIPLLGHADLTSLKIKGWKWNTKPAMAEWDGNKSNVPSGTVKADPFEFAARRFAGGHDIAREYRDFDVPEFWDAYFKAMTESYARLTDTATAFDLTSSATHVTAGAAPADVPLASVAIVDGYLSMLDVATPTFALVAPDLWRDLVLTPKDKTLEYLSSSTGIEEGSLAGFRILPFDNPSALPAGTVLVGAKEAATVHELPGVPLRVEALDLVKGGIDEAMFGYAGTVVEEPKALALVTTTAVEG